MATTPGNGAWVEALEETMYIEIKISKHANNGTEVRLDVCLDEMSTPERRARVQEHIEALIKIMEENPAK